MELLRHYDMSISSLPQKRSGQTFRLQIFKTQPKVSKHKAGAITIGTERRSLRRLNATITPWVNIVPTPAIQSHH